MLISFSVSNFRSIREQQTLDFTASSTNFKPDNVNVVNENVRLLKSIVLYGANASGKTNLIRAFYSFQRFILDSIDLKKGDPIPEIYYDPYLLDKDSKSAPTTFKIEFIGRDDKKYVYEARFDKSKVIYENLRVYETSQYSNLFLRENGEEYVKIFDRFTDKKVDTSVLANNLFLSKVGNSPNEQLGSIYLYFKDIEIWNAANTGKVRELFYKVQELFVEGNPVFQQHLSKLINISDTGIDSVYIEQFPGIEESIASQLLSDIRRETAVKKYRNQTFGVHKVYDGDTVVNTVNFEFVRRQSVGTVSMFAIGGLILNCLLKDTARIIFMDEFDNSLHPDFCKFLIEVFHNPMINKNKSQLAFATHETQLLDKDIFRRDQIWFAEKNKHGQSEFFSAVDFKGDANLREGIAFDRWYKHGKFGGVPHIKKTEFFATYE